jgi:hypothetical protein
MSKCNDCGLFFSSVAIRKNVYKSNNTENLNKLLSDSFYDGVVELDDIGVKREEVNLEEEVDVEREEDIELHRVS